ncbi:LysR family transcriptional regulator [Klebsiella variicola subsp. variicola]|nr:LysR family transcriptional regulator [Klebsiella variicola subsp. variicola]
MGKLEDMALLVAVAEAGGLSAAGRRLSLSPATMTARLKAMEERYQTRLFHRSTRAITLTRAGKILSCRAAAYWRRPVTPNRC